MKLKNKLLIALMLNTLLPIVLGVITYFGLCQILQTNILEVVANRIPGAEDFLKDMLFAIVMILVFTSLSLSLWLYVSIITPIYRMQIAVRNIKEGKLNFSMDVVDTHDEFSMLCSDFEEMRKQLQIVAEENRIHEREGKELVRNISHDLKTPITSIKGYVEGIIDGVADTPEKRDRYLKIIYNKTNEMNSLINELTLYAQLDTNGIPYEFHDINVVDYFNDCAEEIGIELDERDITFRYENYCAKATKIKADPEQLRRVISNIVGNSIKYLDNNRPGNIRLTIKETDQMIQMEIADNGKGIAKGDLPYIFDRFYRTDESRNSATGGSGIGLSIVRKIVEDHDGKIWATSEFGHGTTMFVILKKHWTNTAMIEG